MSDTDTGTRVTIWTREGLVRYENVATVETEFDEENRIYLTFTDEREQEVLTDTGAVVKDLTVLPADD